MKIGRKEMAQKDVFQNNRSQEGGGIAYLCRELKPFTGY